MSIDEADELKKKIHPQRDPDSQFAYGVWLADHRDVTALAFQCTTCESKCSTPHPALTPFSPSGGRSARRVAWWQQPSGTKGHRKDTRTTPSQDELTRNGKLRVGSEKTPPKKVIQTTDDRFRNMLKHVYAKCEGLYLSFQIRSI